MRAGPDSLPQPMPDWLRDVLVTIMVISVTFTADPAHPYQPPSALSIVLSVTAAGLLLMRRRRPILIAIAMVGLFVVGSVWARDHNPGLLLAVTIAIAGLFYRRGMDVGIPVAIGALIAMEVATWHFVGAVFTYHMLHPIFSVAFAGAAGDSVRMHRRYIKAITDRAIRAEQTRESEAARRVTEERLRIARDLHDTVAHQISVISLNAGVASQMMEKHPQQARESLATVRNAARSVLTEIGNLLEHLRSTEAGGAGELDTTPQPSISHIDGLVAKFSQVGMRVVVQKPDDLDRVPAAVGRVAYRIVQEALTNAYKHGDNTHAVVDLRLKDSALTITVTNPASPQPETTGQGFGLIGLQEQAASVRGTIAAGLVDNDWRVTATLPFQGSTL